MNLNEEPTIEEHPVENYDLSDQVESEAEQSGDDRSDHGESDVEEDPDEEIDEFGVSYKPGPTDFDSIKRAMAKVEKARAAVANVSSTNSNLTKNRDHSVMPSMDKVLSRDDGIDDSEIMSQGAHQARTTRDVNKLKSEITRLTAKIGELTISSDAFTRLETRVAQLEIHQSTCESNAKELSECKRAQAKMSETLMKLSKSHTMAYEDIASKLSSYERYMKSAVETMSATVQESAEEPEIAAKVISIRDTMVSNLEGKSQSESSSKQVVKEKTKKPSWMR